MNLYPNIPILLCILSVQAFAQDVEQTFKDAKKTIKEDPVSLSGSISAGSVLYRAYEIAPRRDPFYWTVNANLNFLLFNKVSIPFTAIITQQDKNFSNGIDKFSQPFNQFGLSPKYRWLTVHAGFRTVEFSEYSLSGAMFLGGGVEIKPEKSLLSGTAIYGRFVKAVPKGGVDGIVVSVPAYERWGGGAKLKVGNETNYGEFAFLKIKDDSNSIPFDTALTVTPQENEVISLTTKQKINKFFTVSGDFAFSMFTKNIYQDVTTIERYTYINQIFTPRPSSQYNKALNAAFDFSPGKLHLGLKYKRIDPDYKTLGAIFLTNDVEEISLNAGYSFLKNKINFGAAAGLQHNNLDKIQTFTSQRIIGSGTISYNVSPQFNLSCNYSNFSSNTLPVRDAFTDTIKFVQLTQSGGFSGLYSFGGKSFKSSISTFCSYQESGGNKQTSTSFFNETASYNVSLTDLGFLIAISFLYNSATNAITGSMEGLGPNLSFSKTFVRNTLRLSASAGYLNSSLNGENLNKNQNANFTISWILDKHQTVKADCSYLNKKALQKTAQQFSELRASLAYSYNFGIKKKTFTNKSA